MNLIVEVNQNFVKANTEMQLSSTLVSITPPLDENYWIFRVPLSDKQAIVAFPKFFTVGIGFQHETDWNTNLPYSCDALEIWDHIKHNKGDKAITKDKGLKAIAMLQEAIKPVMEQKHE